MLKRPFVENRQIPAIETVNGLANGYFDMIGRVQRSVHYKDKVTESERFRRYLGHFEPDYLYCNANKMAELKSVAKYDRPQPILNQVNWAQASNWADKHFACMGGSEELDFDTVVAEIDKTTSPGYPWSLCYATKGELIEEKKFRPWFDNFYKDLGKIENYPKYTSFWTSSVKAEMRPRKKAEENALRTFCASATELTVASNKLCLDANHRFYKAGSQGRVWSCVGMSKFNGGWDRLARRLLKHPNGFALDVSSFDASVFRQSLLDICEFRIDCGNYNEEQARTLRTIYHHYTSSTIVLTNGDVVRKDTGGPSGSGNTVVDNTIHLFKILAYCWLTLAPEGMRSYRAFMDNVEAALYGDDNTFTCSDVVVSWFNATSIAAVCAGIGVKITAENDVWTSQSLDKLVFLAQGFKFVEKTWWVPVPETNKVLSAMLGASECHDPRWDLLRAHSLLMDSWWNVELRTILKGYIHHIHKHCSNMLVNGVVHKGTTYEEISTVAKNERQIRALYLCTENTVSAEMGTLTDPFKFVPYSL
nr:RNA-dependent RNA polymerase [Flumine Astrovirus 5]